MIGWGTGNTAQGPTWSLNKDTHQAMDAVPSAEHAASDMFTFADSDDMLHGSESGYAEAADVITEAGGKYDLHEENVNDMVDATKTPVGMRAQHVEGMKNGEFKADWSDAIAGRTAEGDDMSEVDVKQFVREDVDDLVVQAPKSKATRKWYEDNQKNFQADWSKEITDAQNRGDDLGEGFKPLDPELVAKSRKGHEAFKLRNIERQAEYDEFQSQMMTGIYHNPLDKFEATVELHNLVQKHDPGLVKNLPSKISEPIKAFNRAREKGYSKDKATEIAMHVASSEYWSEMMDHANYKTDLIAKQGAHVPKSQRLTSAQMQQMIQMDHNKRLPANIRNTQLTEYSGEAADIAASVSANPVRNFTANREEIRRLAEEFGAGETLQNIAGLASGSLGVMTGGLSKAVINKGARTLLGPAAKGLKRKSLLKGAASDVKDAAVQKAAKQGFYRVKGNQDHDR